MALARGRGVQAQVPIHRLPAEPDDARESGDIDLPRAEGDNLLIAGDPRGMAADAVLLGTILPRRAVVIGGAGRLGSQSEHISGRDGPVDGRALVLEETLERLLQVLEDMETIHDLHRLRRPACNPVRVQVAAITGHSGDGRVSGQPCGHRVGVAIRQEIDRAMAFEVDHDGAEPTPAPSRPVVDPDDRGRASTG